MEPWSQGWAEAWCAALRDSERYRQIAAEWEGAVGLILEQADGTPARAVLLDLWHGDCRSAASVHPDELGEPAFVFQADADGWDQIFSGRGSPVMALLSGRIRLVRGDLTRLIPYAGAAKELLDLIPGGLLPGGDRDILGA